MPDISTDEALIALYKNGDQSSFKNLINRYTPPLYNFIARLTNKNDAPDIVQEIFIKVWKNLNRFDASKASFKTWVFTIARNTATDYLRKKRSLVFSDIENGEDEDINSFAENIPDEQLLPSAALEKIQDKEFLDRILEKLQTSYREVLTLHYQENMTFDEIGKVLNKPLNTVKSQHRRALIELRKLTT
ncbi:MAG: sigma-70 family RNA polymerase sigma factor [bacterium]